jgi:hypothetical protein
MCAFVIATCATFLLLVTASQETLSMLDVIIDVAQIIAPLWK